MGAVDLDRLDRLEREHAAKRDLDRFRAACKAAKREERAELRRLEDAYQAAHAETENPQRPIPGLGE